MKGQAVVCVEPSILRWARESIGLSVPDVAKKLKRSVAEIDAWEAGEDAPTYPQLERLAYELYKRPLAVFFLPSPPVEKPPQKEFRTLPESDLAELLPDTYLRIRKGHVFQLSLEELFEGVNPVHHKIWRNISLSERSNILEQAHLVRMNLGISIEDQVQWRDDDTALKQWRKSIENSGVFVFKDTFKQKDISGFCLIHREFPVIYLNNSTTKTRQIFSLLHELAHLLFNTNGISKFDESYVYRLAVTEKKLEQFCNEFAAEVLIPYQDFQRHTSQLPENVEGISDEEFSQIALRYGVSREAILRRFLDQNRVSQRFYTNKAQLWESQKKGSSSGRGDWYATTNTYLSEKFAQEVVSRHYKNQISVEYASDLLGIRPKNFEGIEQRILLGAGA